MCSLIFKPKWKQFNLANFLFEFMVDHIMLHIWIMNVCKQIYVCVSILLLYNGHRMNPSLVTACFLDETVSVTKNMIIFTNYYVLYDVICRHNTRVVTVLLSILYILYFLTFFLFEYSRNLIYQNYKSKVKDLFL